MAAHPLAIGYCALATTCSFARTPAEKWPLQARIEATSDITIIPRFERGPLRLEGQIGNVGRDAPIAWPRAGCGIASLARRISRASAPITRAYFA